MKVYVPPCHRCETKEFVKLRRQIARNGARQVMWFCTKCERPAQKGIPFIKLAEVETWIEQGKLKIENVDELPLVYDGRHQLVCDVCGAPGTEYHHWLPRCFADQVENHNAWPTSNLCKACHDQWHEFVTPYLPGRGQSSYAQFTMKRYLNGGGEIP